MLGRGLVEPLDLHHLDNPPSHPELLDLLAAEFAEHGFDMRWLLKELAMTRAYQRTSLLAEGDAAPPPAEYRVAQQRPLSAEQLFASIHQATGAAEVMLGQFENESRGQDPRLFEIVLASDALRTTMLEARLATERERFLGAFANPPREPEGELAPSVKAALFLLNDSVVLGWLDPRPGNLVDRLAGMSDRDAAEELYLAILTRLPTAEERAEAEQFVGTRLAERSKALGQLAWALAASTEFYVNH
jgi:hypothetical protein